MKAMRYFFTALAIVMTFTCVTGCSSDDADTPNTSVSKEATTMPTVTTATVEEAPVTGTYGTTTVAEGETTTAEEGEGTTTTVAPNVSVTASAGQTTGTDKTTAVVTTTKATTATTVSKPVVTPAPTPVALTALSQDDYYGFQYVSGQGGSLVAAYGCVADGVAAMAEEILLKDAGVTVTESELKTAMRCYHADYPQHFWYNGAYNYVMDGSGTILSVKPTYTMTASQKQTAQKKVDDVVKELLGKAAYGQTEYARELILHDALADRVKYVAGTNAHNLYGALVEGKAVCEGYARAFQYLLYQSGTQCLFVEGTGIRPGGSKGEAHAWNVVKVGGKYYHTDVTWDDQSDATISVMHAFFNLNDTLIKEGHTISADNPYPIPSCNSTAESYFVKGDIEIKTFSADRIAELFAKGNGTATVYVSKNTVSEFLTWFQANVSDISKKAGLSGKAFSLQYCGREVVITTR